MGSTRAYEARAGRGVARRVGAWAYAALLGCSAPGGGPLGTGGDVDDDGREPSTGDDDAHVHGVPPTILRAPAVVARGTRLYVMVDLPLQLLELEVAGRALDGPRQLLQTDMPGALVPLPANLPLGPTTLVARRRDDPDAVGEHPIEIVAPIFPDVAAATGLAQRHDASGSPSECAESHTGLAFGDYDGDGRPDAFVGHVGRDGRLYRNAGDTNGDGLPEFVDATAAAGVAGLDAVAMATFVEVDGDGDQDLFVGRRGENRMLRNRLVPDGVAAFEDVTAAVGLGDHDQRTMGAAFGDYDGDGDLDLYVVDHAYCFPIATSDVRARDHLYRNDGGVFVERTLDLPGDLVDSVGFSAVWIDIERDGDQDLVVINDDVGGAIGHHNALWRNDGPKPDGGWRFTDVSLASGVGIRGVNGMGLALGDVNGDGLVDMAFTNIGDNVLLLNAGDGTFVDVSEAAGITRGWLPWDRESITWAVHMFDHDDDGDLALYFSGGRIKGIQLVPDAFLDDRGDGTFADLTWAVGLSDPAHGKASVLVDLDRDGAWELATASWSDELRVYHNRVDRAATGHHWLDVELQGRGGNRDALGAIVELDTEAGTQTCFHTQRPSLGGGGETACHFGLGRATAVLAVRITWPDGSTAEPSPPAVDQRIRWVQAP
jgi:enediyne biosynthesis protein E4